MRLLAIAAAAMLAGCGPAPVPKKQAAVDPTQEAWYGQAADQLADMNRRARDLLARGKADEAAVLITDGEKLVDRLLGAPRPTLAALEAASDLDDLYGRMLLANHNYGWARILFQKNVARWKSWKPPSEETLRRLKLAEAAITECDRRMTEVP